MMFTQINDSEFDHKSNDYTYLNNQLYKIKNTIAFHQMNELSESLIKKE